MTSPRLIVAVDPGFDGAIAFLRDGRELEVHDMPCLELTRNSKAKRQLNYHEIGRMFDNAHDADGLWIESVNARPGQGVSSMFAFGKSTGAIIGAAAAQFWRISEVPPATWRKAVGLKTGDGKDASQRWRSTIFQGMPSFSPGRRMRAERRLR